MEREVKFKEERTLSGICCESAGEHVLPDYKGDVRKILMTDAKVVPGGRFAGGGKVEYVGAVLYSVVYLDGENSLCGAEFSTDYQLEVKCDDENYVDSICQTRLTNYTIRLMGPRKFSAKANLESMVVTSEMREIAVTGDAFERETVESYTDVLKVGVALMGELKGKEYEGELEEIEGAIEEEIELLLLNTEPRVGSLSCRNGEAEVTGEVEVTALLTRNGEMPYTVNVTVPISERIEVDGLDEDMSATSYMYVTSAVCNVESSESGVSLRYKICVDVEVFATTEEDVQLCRDCYLCDAEVENEYGDFTYTLQKELFEASESVSLTVPVSDAGIEKIRNVVFARATLLPEEYSATGKNLAFKGKARFSGIACEINEGGELEYSPLKFDAPIDINVNNSCQISGDSRILCHCRAGNVSVTNDADNIYASLTVELWGAADKTASVRRVESCTVSAKLPKRAKSEIIVYYPESDDTLFEVAKRYHTTVMNIAAANSLTESVFNAMGEPGSLAGIKKLIIK